MKIPRLFLFCCVLAFVPLSGFAESKPKAELVFIDSRTKGIYAGKLDLQSGAVTNVILAAEVASPQFLAVDPGRRLLFALNTATNEGKKTGVVSSFSFDPETGKLTFISQQPSGGNGPTHLALANNGTRVLVANYGGGSASVFPVQKDGLIGAMTGFVQHKGGSRVVPQRQEGPHAHHIMPDPSNRFALVCDLGLDQVLIYKFDIGNGKLIANDPPFASLKPGAGPRHLAFHPNGKFVYVINELDSTMTAFEFDSTNGVMKEIQTISTLPKDFSGKNFPAEVFVHPNGKFLYGSNRGHDSIVVYKIDQKTGQMELTQHQSTGGKNPRNFEINTAGEFLFAANQDSANVVILRIDPQTGRLSETGKIIEVETPICVTYVPLK